MRAQLQVIKTELRRRLHRPIDETGRWLNQVLRGHMAYYAVPGNGPSIASFFSTASSGYGIARYAVVASAEE